MDALARIERALVDAVGQADQPGCPKRLAAAMRHAVFPRGARVRPQLTVAIASACGDDQPALTDAAAVAIELLHCASLVHDDLPCFDDAAVRRGRPSVHHAFGEPLAVLAGDALIVLAFQVLARQAAQSPRLAPILLQVTAAVGVPHGIVAGQAWECEDQIDPRHYHRSKTGALFAAATGCGALAAGAEAGEWRPIGTHLGEAYQVADDIADAIGSSEELGKPTGRDAALGRPNAVALLGLDGAVDRLGDLVEAAACAVPTCSGAAELRQLIRLQARRLVPKTYVRQAA